MYYIGAHATENLNDNYMGSGRYIKRAVKKYGRDNFTKTILETFDNKEDMFAREAELVTQKEVDDPMCYNMGLGGYGGDMFIGKTPEERSIIFAKSEEHKRNISIALTGKPKSKEHCRHISEAKKDKTHPGWNKGKHWSEETRKLISNKLKGRPSPVKGKRWRRDPETNKRIYY